MPLSHFIPSGQSIDKITFPWACRSHDKYHILWLLRRCRKAGGCWRGISYSTIQPKVTIGGLCPLMTFASGNIVKTRRAWVGRMRNPGVVRGVSPSSRAVFRQSPLRQLAFRYCQRVWSNEWDCLPHFKQIRRENRINSSHRLLRRTVFGVCYFNVGTIAWSAIAISDQRIQPPALANNYNMCSLATRQAA